MTPPTLPSPYEVPYATPDRAPGVLAWFKVYAVAMALLYVLVIAAGLFFFFAAGQFAQDPEIGAEGARIQGVVLTVVGVPLAAAYAAALFMPRRPWVWIYDVVLIGIGLASCCLLPATIPLLIFWIKPETRGWFGRSV